MENYSRNEKKNKESTPLYKNVLSRISNIWNGYCGSTKLYLTLSVILSLFTYYKIYSILSFFKHMFGNSGSYLFKCLFIILAVFIGIRLFDIYIFTQFVQYSCQKNEKLSYILSFKPIVDSILFIILIYIISKIKGAVELFTM